MKPAALYASPNALAPHYSRFRVAERLLLTGHSHQAWPDAGFAAQQTAWLDTAELVDDVWDRAFAQADLVRRGFARLLGDAPERIALGANTHELVVRFLSALPLSARPRLVTTDGEFHTIRRQMDRLGEEGIQIERVATLPVDDLADRLARAVDDRTAAVLVSAVLYGSGQIVPHLGSVLAACRRTGAELLVDAYHALNVVPYELAKESLTGSYVVGGGYKYCQLGGGNAFLRYPEDCALRPVITGWFSEFADLAVAGGGERVSYGAGPARTMIHDDGLSPRFMELLRNGPRLQVRPAAGRERHDEADGLGGIGLGAGRVERPDARHEQQYRKNCLHVFLQVICP